MSGVGSPDLPVSPMADLRVVIIASSWHTQIMDGLINGAITTARKYDIEPELHRVPGSFELPLAARVAAESGADAIIALGVVIRGGTPHFDYVCQATTEGLSRVTLDSAVPVGFGLLTCDNEEQALDRAGLDGSNEDKGAEAAHAALNMVMVLRSIRNA